MILKKLIPPVAAVALALVAVLGWHAAPSAAARALAGQGLAFQQFDLPDSDGNQQWRTVQPGLEGIRAWISAVGASVGAFDLRGTGVSGDGCSTDPRDDKVRVFPLPGSKGTSYPAFVLQPTGLRHDRTMAPMGCVPVDINQDGRQDVIAYYWGRSPVIFRNVAAPGRPPSPATFHAEELVSPMQLWNTTALNVADVDGDGRLDVMVGNYFPDGARVLDAGATDDPRMQMQHSMGKARNAGANRIYLGATTDPSGPVSFTDVSERWPEESARSWTLALGMQDLTGDSLPEVYVANDFGPDQLMANRSTPGNVNFTLVQGTRDLVTPRSKVLGHDSFKGMGVVYSYEQDQQLPRIMVSNITSPWGLQESNFAFYPTGSGSELLHGRVPYRDRSVDTGLAHSGWSWDIKAADLTNSGRDYLLQATGFTKGTQRMWPRLQEVAMGNDQILSYPKAWLAVDLDSNISGNEPNRLWAPLGDRFVDVGAKVPFSEDEVSRGFAVTDANGDGRLDFLVANQWARSHFYQNESVSKLDWAQFTVVRPAAHGVTPLVGASLTLSAPGYTMHQQLYPANGHSGVSGAQSHFTLPPQAAGHATLTVRWNQDGRTHQQQFPVTRGLQEVKVSS